MAIAIPAIPVEQQSLNLDSVPNIVAQLRKTFIGGATRPYQWRVEQLKRLKAMTIQKHDAIHAALKVDLGKPDFESTLTETGTTISEINYVLKHLRRWMLPGKVATPISNQPGRSKVLREPLGVVLIIAPWNYPFQLMISPLVGAIAAGNCAVLKPSELTPHTSAVLKDGIAEFLDPDAFKVIEGGVQVATKLLSQRFDHIFFTGGQEVGKIVMAAAAKHLTPVTLELGGKSPCIVGHDADLKVAARRIAWGKFINAGQTCVAPDYILVHQQVEKELIERLHDQIKLFYGEDPKASPDYGRIVSDSHFQRLVGLMRDCKTVVGGESDAAQRYIAPTIIQNVSPDSPSMQEEIFGPILPVLTVSSVHQAIEFVNQRPKPLSLYLFSNDKTMQEAVVHQTTSGGVCINDVVMHLAIPQLPFGGVGTSGMGAYHGRASFETFSHAKGVLTKSNRFEIKLRYPPYTNLKQKWVRWMM